MSIGKDSNVESSVLYDNAIIGENVKLSGCVIGENSKVGNFSNLKDIVLGDNETLEENTSLDNKAVWTQPKPEGYPDKQIGNPIEK